MDNSRMMRAGVIFVMLFAITYGLGVAPLGVSFSFPQTPVGQTLSLRQVFEGKDLGPGPYPMQGFAGTITYTPGSFLQKDIKLGLIDVTDFENAPGYLYVITTFYCGDTTPTHAWAIVAGTDGTNGYDVPIKARGTYTLADLRSHGPIVPDGNCIIVSGTYTSPSLNEGKTTSYAIMSSYNPVGNSWNIYAPNAIKGVSANPQVYYVGYLKNAADTDALIDGNGRFVPAVVIDEDGPSAPGDDIWGRLGIVDKNMKLLVFIMALLGVSYLGAGHLKF